MHLRLMYMPQKNYADLDPEFMFNYWRQDKDIIGVTHFGDLVYEVLWLGDAYEKKLCRLIARRVEQKRKQYQKGTALGPLSDEITALAAVLKKEMEAEIIRRLSALRQYQSDPYSDPHISLETIFKQ